MYSGVFHLPCCPSSIRILHCFNLHLFSPTILSLFRPLLCSTSPCFSSPIDGAGRGPGGYVGGAPERRSAQGGVRTRDHHRKASAVDRRAGELPCMPHFILPILIYLQPHFYFIFHFICILPHFHFTLSFTSSVLCLPLYLQSSYIFSLPCISSFTSSNPSPPSLLPSIRHGAITVAM